MLLALNVCSDMVYSKRLETLTQSSLALLERKLAWKDPMIAVGLASST